jgi:uridine kinase
MPILAVDAVVAAIRAGPVSAHRPVVAIDGRSGSGKSTVAEAVAQAIGAVIVPCDQFFAASMSNAEWDRRTPEQRAADAIDWHRLKRETIEPLRTGRPARWYAFDFLAGPRGDGTYPMQRTPTELAPKPVVLLDGAYSARPELAEVLNLSVLVEAAPATRGSRRARRQISSGSGSPAGIQPKSTTLDTCARPRPSTWFCKRMGLLPDMALQRTRG